MAALLLRGARRPVLKLLRDPCSSVHRGLSSITGDHSEHLSDSAAAAAPVMDTSNLWPVFREPVHLISTFLDGVHSATGAPWWIVLAGSTLAMRTALLPFNVLQLQKTAQFARLAWQLPPPVPLPGTDVPYLKHFKFFNKKRKELGVPSPAWFIAPLAVQVPIFISWIVTIRQMAITKYPGFDSGGILWFSDLTTPVEGLGLLFPTAVVMTYVCNIEVSLKGLPQKPGALGTFILLYSWWLRLCSIPIYITGTYLPQGVFMYWLPNSIFSLLQTLAFRSDRVKRALNLPVISPNAARSMGASTTQSDALIRLAAEHVARSNRDEAVQCLRNVIQGDPENATAYFALGKLHADSKQWFEAAEFFTSATSKAKQENLQLSAYVGLAMALHNQGKLEDGITALKSVAGMKVPEDADSKKKYYMALVTLGSMLNQAGQKVAALEYLERAAEYDPKVGDLYVNQIKKQLAEAEAVEEAGKNLDAKVAEK